LNIPEGYNIRLLWSSLEGLSRVSVPLLVVARNLVPFFTAINEALFFKEKFSLQSYVALLMVCVGSIIYVSVDNTLDFKGFSLVALNLVFSVITPLVEKKLVKGLMDEQTPTGLQCYRNFISIPVFLIIILSRGYIHQAIQELLQLPSSLLFIIFLSCFFGFSISLSVFFLQTLVTATSVVTANTWYKLCTLLVSLIYWPIPFNLLGIYGITASFCGVAWYTYLRTHPYN